MPKEMADGASSTPTEFAVGNHPNPFNPNTSITYALPKRSDVSLTIYDVMGREILSNKQLGVSAGHYQLNWIARDTQGAMVPAGIYFYRLIARPIDGSETFVETRKMLLLK